MQQERVTLTVLGAIALAGCAVLLWQGQRPAVTVVGSPAAVQAAQWDEQLAAARTVDVNTATVAALERLPGVGPALAARIVDYRTAHGPFGAPEELTRVHGIGPKTVAALRDYLAVEE